MLRLPGDIPVNLLPYHDIARVKHEKLGHDYHPGGYKEPDDELISRVIKTFESFGIEAVVGG